MTSTSFTVTTSIQISLENLGGLLCSAFEGGVSRSWCRIMSSRKPRKPITSVFGEGPTYSYIDYPLQGGRVTCRDEYKEEETDGKFTPLHLDKKAVERGLQVMAQKYPKSFADLLEGDYDAYTGDVFLQCALLGEVLYG